jgi:hypothetical protein
VEHRIDEDIAVSAPPSWGAEQALIAAEEISERAHDRLNRSGNNAAIGQKERQQTPSGRSRHEEKTAPADEGNEYGAQR